MTAPLTIVTGLSGAGRTTALRALEDTGCDVIDNLPLDFLAVVRDHAPSRALAVGMDARTRGFSAAALLQALPKLRQQSGGLRVVYLECADDILLRRYTETRRRHPLAVDRAVIAGIARERELLAPLRAAADVVIDTTTLTPHDLRQRVTALTQQQPIGLHITLLSFAYREGLPRDADIVIDVRFLRNPHYDAVLRPQSGQQTAVQRYVMQDESWPLVTQQWLPLLQQLLPRYIAEGKSYLTIAVGCTGGKHRSVTVVEYLAQQLQAEGFKPAVLHRDLDLEEGL